MFSILKKLFGTSNDRFVKNLFKEVEKINAFESKMHELSDIELSDKTKYFKNRLSNGDTLDDIAYEAFAVVREAAKRVLGMRHFDVQLIGGLVMHRGMITEMRTGEGKTLVATLPAYLNSLSGLGVHVVTANDYLAKRDSEWMGRLYHFLGLSVGCVIAGMNDSERKQAYASDITYATNNELGFDFLRDNMKFSHSQKAQTRGFNYVIVDEVDSILIDEARTPLIISGPVDDNSELYMTMDRIVRLLGSDDYEKDEKVKTVNLTEVGTNKIEELLISNGIIKEGTGLYDFENMSLVHYVTQALRAHTMFSLDVDYIVKDNRVIIIDEFTGRIMDGRRYSEGLHQALEAKERVEIQNENQTLASITFQNFFRMYSKLSGMTGTAMTEAAEFKDIYNMDVISIPTHHKVKRIDHDDEIYGNKDDKYNAILSLVRDCYERGQPVLVGTVSIEKSEDISEMLKRHNIQHNVLNAKYHEQEAYIIAQAGRYKAVTIATNMAGRGTDIMLGGNPEMLLEEAMRFNKGAKREDLEAAIIAEVRAEKAKVIEVGGMFILGTERHESRRIDNQLRGRSGRQGDPGETRFYLSLDDDLMRIFASDRISSLLRTLGLKGGEAIQHPMVSRALEKAQQKVESHNYEIRKNLIKFDDVMNDQRNVIYKQRNEIMEASNVSEIRENMLSHVIEEMVMTYMPQGTYREDWDVSGLIKAAYGLLGVHITENMIIEANVTEIDVIKSLTQHAQDAFALKEKNFGNEVMQEATKYMLMTTLDQVWKDHLHYLDHLRHGISLRAYGQKDPLNEYKREAFVLFEEMLKNLREMFIQRISHVHIDANHINKDALSLQSRKSQSVYETRDDPALTKHDVGVTVDAKLKQTKPRVKPEDRDKDNPKSWGRVARNELCPCASGKKYKHCHGQMLY